MLDAVDLAKSRFVKFIATKLYVGRLLHGAPCLRALCEAEVQSMRTFGLRNPICLIPNGVDFKPVVGVAAPWKDRLPRGAKILLYIGRIHPKKGISFLLDGWARARKESAASSDWHLVIAGWEQYGHEGQLKAQSKALGLDANVHFIGPQFGNGKAAAFANADALVLPSTSEGLPTVVLEAWTSGLPVVITPQCNIPEGVKAGAALEIATEAGDIARGLSTLFSMTADQRREMGDKGRQLVGDKFAWPRIATEMKRVYDWMLGGGTPPDCVRRN
jgi:poly(glycerol-phosphate) alpha-glucosyltransferase